MAYDVKTMGATAKTKSVTVLRTPRQPYFEGIGTNVKSAGNVEEAMRLSNLNFRVEKRPIQFITEKLDIKTGNIEKIAKLIPDQFACVRMDTKESCGVVGRCYTILQNEESFSFLDSLADEITFESAGLYHHKSCKSFIVINTEPMKILNDDVEPYICLCNSFDGSGSVRAAFTPMRKLGSIPYIRTIHGVHNKISIKHTTNLKKRMDAAKLMLLNNTNYLNAIKAEAEKMALTTYTDAQFKDLARRLFASAPDATDIQKLRNEAMVDELISMYNQEDLACYNNSVYKAVLAVASLESNLPCFRNTKTIQYKNINNVLAGYKMTDAVATELMS